VKISGNDFALAKAESCCVCLFFLTGLPEESIRLSVATSTIREIGRSDLVLWKLLLFVVDMADTLEFREIFDVDRSDISDRRVFNSSTSSGSSTIGENAGPPKVIGG
jgi:hypothetical protein